jgi:hypothetical protein
MLCPGGDGFIDQVKDYIYLPTKKKFYSPGKSNKAICGNVDLTFRSGIRSTDPAKDAGNFCMSVLKAWKNTCIKIKHF